MDKQRQSHLFWKMALATNRYHFTNVHSHLFAVFLICDDKKETVVHVETHPRMAILYS